MNILIKGMEKRRVRKILKRFSCPHFYWHEVSPFMMGSFHRGVIECEACGKRKLIEFLKDYEVLNNASTILEMEEL